MKVVMGGELGARFVEEFRREFPQVEFVAAVSEEEQEQAVADADVYFGWPSRRVFLAARRLRWIQAPSTGIDRLTAIPELVDSDVVLTNMRGDHAPPMADHVMGMVVALAHRFKELLEDQRAHRWDMRKYAGRVLELEGATMGILALGDIGRAVARRAHAFGMEVYAVDARPMEPPPEVRAVWGPERLDDLLAMSDWFVVAAPLTRQTRGLLDRRRIFHMKKGAHLIVISRGGIVDEEALVEALRSGHLAGAGLDVTAQEPLPSDSPLWDLENVIISPHSSALIPSLWEKRLAVFRENLRRFLDNRPLLYICDKEAGF